MTTYLCVYLGALVLALLATPIVIRLAQRLGAVDLPNTRKIHGHPVPRIGGVAIFLSAMVLIASVVFLNNSIGEAFRTARLRLATILVCATVIFGIGLVDDLRGLRARVKFLIELLIALTVCLVGVRISRIELTDGWVLPLGGFGWLLTILWIVGVTNAINLSDGLDGLAAGISAIACGVIAVLAIRSGSVIMAVFMLALLGSLSGFLFFNFNPAKVFMGDCGSLFLGFTIASASVMCATKSAAIVGLALPALALGIPIFDTLFAMLRRFLERRSLFAPDRSHFHHRLLELGLHQRHAVMTIYLATLTAAGLGLFMLVSDDMRALAIFACILFLILLLFQGVGAVRVREVIKKVQDRCAESHQQGLERRDLESLQLRVHEVQTFEQWWETLCSAGARMDFAWISLRTTSTDGRIDEETWRAPRIRPDLSRIMRITIPLEGGKNDVSRQCEIAIYASDSVEAASRRAVLFGRLLDESRFPFAVQGPVPAEAGAARDGLQRVPWNPRGIAPVTERPGRHAGDPPPKTTRVPDGLSGSVLREAVECEGSSVCDAGDFRRLASKPG